MAFPGIVQTRRSLHEREIRAGIPAVAAMLVVEIVAVRWLLATARGFLAVGWVSVAIAGWTLGVGILGWLMATRRDAGLIFLWAMFLAGTVSLAGGIASSGGAEWVGRAGYAALAFLSAVTIHFHVIFPRKMRPGWRRAVLAAAYGFAGMLALVWVFYPVPFSNNLRLLSRAFFGLSGLLAWARMFYVGRYGGGLEEKWVGRWLSLVLFVGGLIPAWGYLMSQVVLGRPMISLPTAFLFEMAIPLGYFVMVERYGPWREGKSVPRIVSGVVVAMAEATALVWAWGYLAAAHRGTWLTIVVAVAMVMLFFPLYRITWALVQNDLYGGWYNRERFLKKFSAALEGAEGEELWRRAVRALAEGMKIEQVCGRSAAGGCFCWRSRSGEAPGECPQESEMELPVGSRGEVLGKLYLSRHIEGSGLGRKDRLAIETAAGMVGMKLEATRARAEVKLARGDLVEIRRRLAESREAERLRLARELHDGPMQDLYGLIFRLGVLPEDMEDGGNLGQMAMVREELSRVIDELRAICKELRPPSLVPFGLEAAVRSHAGLFQEAHPELEVQVDLVRDGQTLPETVRMALFRIYQEAISNVARHAGANRVLVRFYLTEKQLLLEVSDDGRGFDVSDRWILLARQGHMGLLGMAERADSIGGRLEVESVLGKGTVVRVVVPRREE